MHVYGRIPSAGKKHRAFCVFQTYFFENSIVTPKKVSAQLLITFTAISKTRVNSDRLRQWGRVLATQDEEVVVDRLFAGNIQLIKALQALVEAAETTLQLDEAREGDRRLQCLPGLFGAWRLQRLSAIRHSPFRTLMEWLTSF